MTNLPYHISIPGWYSVNRTGRLVSNDNNRGSWFNLIFLTPTPDQGYVLDIHLLPHVRYC